MIANAGHLPPYLNTQEVRLPGGLPLGVVNEVISTTKCDSICILATGC